uniref:I-set domain-containing protein n=1 Tax=Angiostrongylus cantonensis TaxID=6313 RepID=A0A0K0DFS0_ANGCA
MSIQIILLGYILHLCQQHSLIETIVVVVLTLKSIVSRFQRKRRPKVEYTSDGRKILDGVVTDEKTPDNLWTTTISRGVANDWKEKAAGGPFYKIKHCSKCLRLALVLLL